MDNINLDTPPRKNLRTTTTASCYSINPYAKGLKNKIDIILHKGGVPPPKRSAQAKLLPGGMTLSVQWRD